MKYYHIIYNSSEKPMDGGVGFGIRTATEGTPKELLNAVKGIKFFTDDWESYEDKPTPAKMKEDPSSIESIAKNYAVTSITDEQGKMYYVIARRAYVGFDYSFYKNGMPTRPGNYVIDYYVFESAPESSVYEILYERALPGSNHFIPSSVQPTEDNVEMREISIGSQPALPVVDNPFTAEVENALDKDVAKLFFTYLKSQGDGKKLVVKASKEKALKLTADLYRMLEPDSANFVRTYVNLRSQGINDGFDIFFIHEDYPHQIYPGLYDYMEIDSALMPETDEARNFGHDLENLVCSSFTDNRDDIRDTLIWLLMPEYEIVKSLSKITIDSFFCYCIQPGNFTYEHLKDTHGNLNDEFLKVLCPYTKKNEKNAERFNLLITEAMNDATAENVLRLIKDYNNLLSIGFDMDDITKSVKQNVCTQLLSDIKLFKKALDTISLDGIKKFFVKSIFEGKNEYVNSDLLDDYMLDLYRWFLTEEELGRKNNVLYNRFMKRDMPSNIFCSLVDDVFGKNEDSKIKYFILVLQKELKSPKVIWPYLQHYLSRSTENYNFIKEFESKIEDVQYAPLFYYSLTQNKASIVTTKNIDQFTSLLAKNPELKNLVAANFKKDGLYNGLYRELKKKCDEHPQYALNIINDNVLGFLKIKDPSFSVLAFYLEMIVTGDYSKVRQLTPESLKMVYNEINEHHNAKLFQDLLPFFVNASQKGVIPPQDIATKFKAYYPQVKTLDMLKKLVPPTNKGWIEMVSAILSDVNHKPFQEAFDIAKKFGMDSESIEHLMMEYYGKDYLAYKRKNKIKYFFASLKRLFMPKKKDKKLEEKEIKQTPSTSSIKEKDR